MPLLTDLEEFVHDHRSDGRGACPCGVVFGRWVTPEKADRDLTSWSAFEVSRN